jgi:hypothetical protein
MTKRRTDDTVIGEDAFLDTIANLVGILIILVFIVAANTRTVAEQITQAEIEAQAEKLDDPVSTAKNIDNDLARQEEELAKHSVEVAYRSAEREHVLEQVLAIKQDMDDAKSELTDDQRIAVEQHQQLSSLEQELMQLENQGDNLSQEKPAIVLQHLPTPMAKTVFGKELHLMIKDQQITVIPWDMLVERLKKEARAAVARSTRRDRIVEQIGPFEGFVMEYSLVSTRGLVSNGTATAMAQMVQLEKFELEPTAEILHQSMDEAMSSNGRLRIELSNYPPRETTITAWVYPESFETFRQLKERLFSEGYLTAARPIPNGVRIGASPRGSSSTAQ